MPSSNSFKNNGNVFTEDNNCGERIYFVHAQGPQRNLKGTSKESQRRHKETLKGPLKGVHWCCEREIKYMCIRGVSYIYQNTKRR